MSPDRRYVIENAGHASMSREDYLVAFMASNKAYRYAVAKKEAPAPDMLKQWVQRYQDYRTAWRAYPAEAIAKKWGSDYAVMSQRPPLSVDIEIAAVCDLACPFCYRQSIVTPDKLIHENLYYRLIDQCAELGVASLKLNWRGEPLLHPNIGPFIDYAKQSGIMEVMINTSATTLDADKAELLIDAGLDVLIYSFDGGSKETYEKMRPGRFRQNHFETVYRSIQQFYEIRESCGAKLPYTKIQMILTKETFHEKEQFLSLFRDYVDNVSVKAYTERGGALADLAAEERDAVQRFLEKHQLPSSMPYWKSGDGEIFVAQGRLPCEQIYQRLMVTYDGRVSMCCYDWGSEYPIGYVDERAYVHGDEDYDHVQRKAARGHKGFERMTQIKMPRRYVTPPHRVQTLKEIWEGTLLGDVRQKHVSGHLAAVPICAQCPFKETYAWEKIDTVE